MLKRAVRQRVDRPLRKSNRNAPTRIHVVQENEYRLRDPSVRDDIDDAPPTRGGLFDVTSCQTELAKTERHDRCYRIDERSSGDSLRRRRIFAGSKKPDTWRVLPNLSQSRMPTGSQHGEK